MKVIMEKWVSVFGAPERLMSDNGLEFQNEPMKKMCEKMGIVQWATPAESPWSNGKCEKMVGLIKEDGFGKEMAMYWTVVAKNSMLEKGGYSAYARVFGKNPRLPLMNVDEEKLVSEIEIGEESGDMKEVIDGLHKAREIHVKQEAEERIRRALMGQIVEHKVELAQAGEKVYYKRSGENEWRGPAVVIGRDGKTVVVKHGGTL